MSPVVTIHLRHPRHPRQHAHSQHRYGTTALAQLLAVAVLATCAVSAHAEPQRDAEIEGVVQSFASDEFEGDGHGYYLLTGPEAEQMAGSEYAALESQLRKRLDQRGYVAARRLPSADVVVLLRFGKQRSEASDDAHIHYLKLEAYDAQGYLDFLARHGERAAPGATLDFIVWEIAVEVPMRGRTLGELLPRSLAMANAFIETNAARTRVRL